MAVPWIPASLVETPRVRDDFMKEFNQSDCVSSVLQALAMTIRVDKAELECLHGSVRRLLMNMSKHTQDVDFTLAASMCRKQRRTR